jgi:hypothetical protein
MAVPFRHYVLVSEKLWFRTASTNLKVPKREIFDLLFFYINKSGKMIRGLGKILYFEDGG